MAQRHGLMRQPRIIGVACAIAATGLGLLYLTAAGAPAINLVINAIALVMGLAIVAVVPASGAAPRFAGAVIVALAALVLVTALVGTSAEGASRWIRIAGMSVQTSLIVMPAILVGFARRRDRLATAGVMLTAIALAVQPDRAMAGVLACALALLAVQRPDRRVASALVVGAVCFGATLLRPDTLPAVPFVDRIFYTAFDVHAAIGVAVAGGALLLVVPAVAGWLLDPENRHVHSVFGVSWLCIAAAAAIGNYPTPLVGYGASAVLGYLLSVSALPRTAASVAQIHANSS